MRRLRSVNMFRNGNHADLDSRASVGAELNFRFADQSPATGSAPGTASEMAMFRQPRSTGEQVAPKQNVMSRRNLKDGITQIGPIHIALCIQGQRTDWASPVATVHEVVEIGEIPVTV